MEFFIFLIGVIVVTIAVTVFSIQNHKLKAINQKVNDFTANWAQKQNKSKLRIQEDYFKSKTEGYRFWRIMLLTLETIALLLAIICFYPVMMEYNYSYVFNFAAGLVLIVDAGHVIWRSKFMIFTQQLRSEYLKENLSNELSVFECPSELVVQYSQMSRLATLPLFIGAACEILLGTGGFLMISLN